MKNIEKERSDHMNIDEIKERIELCQKRELDYREVDNSRQADKYSEEAYKWEKLLEQLDPNLYQEMETYKKGYFRLERAFDEVSRILNKVAFCGSEKDYMEIIDQALSIVDKESLDEITKGQSR